MILTTGSRRPLLAIRMVRKEISPAERIRIAHERSPSDISADDSDEGRSSKILAMIAGLILAGTGIFVSSQITYIPPIAGFFFLQALGGVAVAYVALMALVEDKSLPYWSVILSWWALPIAVLFIWISLFAPV